MRGHIRRRGATWSVVIDVGRENGKRKQHWDGGHPTRAAAEDRLAVLLGEVRGGYFVPPTNQTFAEFLRDEWTPVQEGRVPDDLKPSTMASYRAQIRNHIVPRVGHVPLRALSPTHLNHLYRDLRESGSLRDGGGLSTSSVKLIHTIIHSALDDAFRWGRVQRNVASLATAPSVKRAEVDVWSPEQMQEFLRHAEGHRFHPCFLLAVATGMRRGELAGLRWKAVDLDRASLTVNWQRVSVEYEIVEGRPKSNRSRRTIALDGGTVTMLRRHRARQQEERLAAATHYNQRGFVFVDEMGDPPHPEAFSRAFLACQRGTGLPRKSLHTLRHAHATYGLLAGVSPKVISDRLGHSSVAFTLDRYAHVLAEVGQDAADRIAGVINGQRSA